MLIFGVAFPSLRSYSRGGGKIILVCPNPLVKTPELEKLDREISRVQVLTASEIRQIRVTRGNQLRNLLRQRDILILGGDPDIEQEIG